MFTSVRKTIHLGDQKSYSSKIRALFGSSVIAYWPLWESSGSVANDISGNVRNGAYTGVDLGYPGIGDGHTCPYFDGASDYVNVYSAGLAAAFNGAEGSVLTWAKVYNAGVWTDGLYRFLCQFYVDGNNCVAIRKVNTNDMGWRYVAGGASKSLTLTVTSTTFMCIGLSWSKTNDRMRAFYNGLQTGIDQNFLGVWAGNLNANSTVIGAANITPSSIWYGYIAHGVLLNREATPAEMAKAATI